jgi:citrate synthase
MATTGRRARDLPPLAFPSALTQISGGVCSYRGVPVVELAGERTYEEVAEWLWVGEWPTHMDWPLPIELLDDLRIAQLPVPARALPLDRMRIITAVAAALDDLRHDTSAAAAVATARRLIRLIVHALPRADGAATSETADAGEAELPIAEVLWTRLSPLPPSVRRIGAMQAALVLMADHELAASTLAVRAAAMVRADPYEVIGTGLNVAGGVRHGGASLLLEAMFRDVETAGLTRAVGEHLRRGARLAGFGHSLYPDGDPRAIALMARLDDLEEDGPSVAVVHEPAAAMAKRGTPPPNVDLALAGLAHASSMVPGAGQAIFVVARTAGWIAHALEQYDQPNFLRARTIPR